MKYISSLNIYKRLNNGEIAIGKLSISAALILLLFDNLFMSLLSIPFIEFFLLLGGFSKNTSYFCVFLGEFCAATFTLFIICYALSKINKTMPVNPSRKLSNEYFYGALFIIGFRFFYEGSISHLTNLIPIPQIIVESFERISTNYLYLFLSVWVFAPFIEEFMYRGIILNGFLKKYSPKVAIILSSLIFAAMHMNWPQGINAFILGTILATIFYKTRSIYLCIFMHFINNLCAHFILLIQISPYLTIVQSIAFVILGFSLIVYSIKNINIFKAKMI